MTTYGNLALSYNDDGELTQKQNTTTGEAATFTYSTLGTLTQAGLPNGRNITYAYDALGNLVAKKEDGAAAQGFLYAPGLLGPVTELNADGNPEANFIYATRSNVPDYMVRSGRTYRLITDQVGSVRMVVDAETGSVEQAIDYDAFGRVLSDSNPGFQPFGFAGGIYDRDTKLTHFGAREYDAELGRWTSSDPIGFAGGDSNLCGYVLGDPVNLIDPSGLYGLGNLVNDFTGTINEIPNSFASGAVRDYFGNYVAGAAAEATFGLSNVALGIDPKCMGAGFGLGGLVGGFVGTGYGLKGSVKLGRQYLKDRAAREGSIKIVKAFDPSRTAEMYFSPDPLQPASKLAHDVARELAGEATQTVVDALNPANCSC